MVKNPKNVEALFAWYEKHRPDMLTAIKVMFNAAGDKKFEAFQALSLQGFEAGREFEKAHPEVESGSGYLNE